MTGMSVQESDLAMRQSMGAWGSTVYDRRGIAEASAFNVGVAQTVASSGGRWDAAWVGADAGQFGLRMSRMGNQYWASHRKDLGRMWAAGGGDAAWDAMISGEGMPDDIGSYGDIGDYNARLESQFYGMQMAAEDPGRMTAAAMGMYINKMDEAGAHSDEARIMYMMNKGWDQNEAARYLDMHEQMSTPQGRAEAYFQGMRTIENERVGDIRTGLATVIGTTGQLSQESNVNRVQAISRLAWSGMIESGNQGYLASVTGAIDDYNLDPMIGVADDGTGRYDLNILSGGLRGTLQRAGETSTEASRLATEVIFGGVGDLDVEEQMALLGDLRINRGTGGVIGRSDINVMYEAKVKAARKYNVPVGMVTDELLARYLSDIGGMQNLDVGEGRLGDITSNLVENTSLFIEGSEGRAIMDKLTGEGTERIVQEMYDSSVMGTNVESLLASRYGVSEARATAMEMAGEAGYFENIGAMTGYDAYARGTRQMDAVMLLGEVTEGAQGYRTDRAHREQYGNFTQKLETKGFTFSDAVSGLDSSLAEDQIEARDRMAQAGFDKSYAQLSQTERNYVEEIFHKSDNTSGNDWAGRHDDVVDRARETVRSTMGGVQYGSYEATGEAIGVAAEEAGTTAAEIESYSLYIAALNTGADTDVIKELEGEIGDLEAAEEGFRAYRLRTDQGIREAAANIASHGPQGIIAAEASAAGLTDAQQARVWEHYASTGGFEGLDTSGFGEDFGDSVLGRAVSSNDIAGFFQEAGAEVPYGVADRTRHMTNIPEFHDAIRAVVTPAAGAMPVVVENADDISGYNSIYHSDSEAEASDSNSGEE